MAATSAHAADPTGDISHSNRSDASANQQQQRLYVAFSSLLLMTLVVALDGTTVAVGLAAISNALHGTAIEAFWTGTAYTLCSTVFQPVFASFSYALGRKSMILVALGLFAAGAILCGVASNFTMMLTGRSLQGVGGAGLIAMTEVVLTDLIPLRQRGTYTGVIASMYALGGGVGPIIGGALAESAWRWIFWINLPLIGVALITVVFFLPLQRQASVSKQQLSQIDWIGTVLFVGGVTTTLLPITWGGVQHPWNSWRTILPLCVGVVTLTAFALYENRYANAPLIPSRIFPNYTAVHGYLASGLQGLVTYSLVYFLPLYMQAVKGYSPLTTGCALLPFSAGIAPSAALTGYLITKLGRYRWSIWLGWAIASAGAGLLLLLTIHTPTVEWVFLILSNAIGNGMIAPATQFQIQAAQKDQRTVGLSLAMFSFTRSIGQTLGIAIGGVIFQNSFREELLKISTLAPDASQLSKDATMLGPMLKSMPPGLLKTQLLMAYTDALKPVWILCLAMSAFALATSLRVRSYGLDAPIVTDQGLESHPREIELQ